MKNKILRTDCPFLLLAPLKKIYFTGDPASCRVQILVAFHPIDDFFLYFSELKFSQIQTRKKGDWGDN